MLDILIALYRPLSHPRHLPVMQVITALCPHTSRHSKSPPSTFQVEIAGLAGGNRPDPSPQGCRCLRAAQRKSPRTTVSLHIQTPSRTPRANTAANFGPTAQSHFDCHTGADVPGEGREYPRGPPDAGKARRRRLGGCLRRAAPGRAPGGDRCGLAGVAAGWSCCSHPSETRGQQATPSWPRTVAVTVDWPHWPGALRPSHVKLRPQPGGAPSSAVTVSVSRCHNIAAAVTA